MSQIRIPGLYTPITVTDTNNMVYFQLDSVTSTTYSGSVTAGTHRLGYSNIYLQNVLANNDADARTYAVSVSPQTGLLSVVPSTGTLKFVSGTNMFTTDVGFASTSPAFLSTQTAATPFVWTPGICPLNDSLGLINKFGEQQITLSGKHQYYQTHQHERRDITWSYIPGYAMFISQETSTTTGRAFENFWKKFNRRCNLIEDLNGFTYISTDNDYFLLAPIETLDASRQFVSPALYEFNINLSKYWA